MSKILVIADIYAETQYFVDSIPLENQVAIALQVTNTIGSKTLNASRVLAKLGNDVFLFGKIGSDQNGSIALETIKDKYNLNPDFIYNVKNSSTGQLVVITNNNGKSSITIQFGANKLVNEEDIDHISKYLSGFDMVYSATNLTLPLLYKLVDKCNNFKVPIFIDVPNQQKEIDLKKLNNTTFIAPNRQEAELLLGIEIQSVEDAKSACIQIRENFIGNIIITLDEDGCVVLEKEKLEVDYYAASKQTTVDSTGAGDIFRAVFVSEYLNTSNISRSIQKAQLIASKSVKIKGVENTINNLDVKL